MCVPKTLSHVTKNGCEKLNLLPRSWWCTSWYAVLFQKQRWNTFPGSQRPQWSSTPFTVQSEKKKMEARGDMPEARKASAPPSVSRRRPSAGWLYCAPNA